MTGSTTARATDLAAHTPMMQHYVGVKRHIARLPCGNRNKNGSGYTSKKPLGYTGATPRLEARSCSNKDVSNAGTLATPSWFGTGNRSRSHIKWNHRAESSKNTVAR